LNIFSESFFRSGLPVSTGISYYDVLEYLFFIFAIPPLVKALLSSGAKIGPDYYRKNVMIW
jgi:hypothetical protein